jgi:hypothetical protein
VVYGGRLAAVKTVTPVSTLSSPAAIDVRPAANAVDILI